MTKRNPSLDSVTTINEDGSRFFIHPADVGGRFTSMRRVAGWLLIAVYALLPWVQVGGFPAVFLDVANGRFHFFGLTIVANDMWLMFFFVSGLAFALFFVTALAGRLWCGWACPQTVFLDHVFRRIERWIEGDAPARRKLDDESWTTSKVIKRVAKHAIFLVISLLIAHMFLAYFVSIPGLYQMARHSPFEHLGSFLFVFALGFILYGNFAWFREQFCIILCPYGRFQSALIDEDSIVIGYDEERGEPRGKATDPLAGDCIDCRRCVQVCPTGIDIRQGLQMECIACSNCVDACDEIMLKLGRPRGLVRYDSLNGLAHQARRIFRPRIILYLALMLIGAVVMVYTAATRLKPATLAVARMTGAPYYLADGQVRNTFMVTIVNKRNEPAVFQLAAGSEAAPSLQAIGIEEPVALEANAEIRRTLVATMPEDDYRSAFPLDITLTEPGHDTIVIQHVEFLGP